MLGLSGQPILPFSAGEDIKVNEATRARPRTTSTRMRAAFYVRARDCHARTGQCSLVPWRPPLAASRPPTGSGALLHLRTEGCTWPQVAEEVGYSCAQHVCRAVTTYLRKVPAEDADALRATETEHLPMLRRETIALLRATQYVVSVRGDLVRDDDGKLAQDPSTVTGPLTLWSGSANRCAACTVPTSPPAWPSPSRRRSRSTPRSRA